MKARLIRETYLIEDGPDRETLFDSLKYAQDKEVVIPVHFKLRAENDDIKFNIRNVKIRGIDHDGDNTTGHAFVIRGKIDICIYSEVCYCDYPTSYETLTFEACYDTQTHRGRLMLVRFRP